ncbi:hypothetical protein ACF0H5_007024 [Mactra antiquata]
MSFSYGSKSRRHKPSGGHFKLFSDELPQIDLDKASLEEITARLKNENRRLRGRRRTFRDSNHDRFSLPSLGTPELDKMSDTEKTRPASYSSANPLNPNFSKIHQKIQRRHTLKETKVNDWNRTSFGHGQPISRKQNNDSRLDKTEYISAWQEISHQSQNKIEERPMYESTLENLDEEIQQNIDKNDINNIKRPVEEPVATTKKKSVLKELLDAASKENIRMNQIKEGLNFTDGYLRRHYSLRSLPVTPSKVIGDHQIPIRKSLELEKKVESDTENVVPEIISIPGKTKPGILKHGARVRDSKMLTTHHKPPNPLPVQPRLVHHDDLPHFGQGKHPFNDIDDVKVSVHTAAPLNRIDDLVFVPLPSNKGNSKQKRVNFNEKIDVKEKTAVSDFIEANEDDNNSETTTKYNNNQSVVNESVKVTEDDKTEIACQRVTSTQIRRRANVKYRETPKAKEFVSIIRRHPSIDNGRKTTIVPRVTKHSTVSKEYIESIYSPKLQAMQSGGLRKDPTWKEAKPELNGDNTALDNETDGLENKTGAVDKTNTVNNTDDKDTKTSLHLSPDGKQDSRTASGVPVLNLPEIQEFFRNGGSPSPYQSPPKSPMRSPPRSPDIDFESLSEFTTLFSDEFDFDLPQEIDRSMLGEDLIKAYRFWDRKKKAFPGGLRKIEAPTDRQEGAYSKDYGNVKTYKINSSRLDRPSMLSSNNKNSNANEVLMDWV